jgi:Zn-dependent protease with chaperone function
MHRRLFALRERMARRLSLAAGMALLAIPLSAAAIFALGLFATFLCWSLLEPLWPIPGLVLILGSAPAVLAGYVAARLLSVLFAPLPAPQGVRLEPEDARDLFRLIDDMSGMLEGARIDYVWITPAMNAAVLQRPRRRFFGRIENHLLLGLPLAHSLSCKQLTAVLAHEFAHLSVQRKGFGKYGALLRAWWLRALDKMSDVFPALGALADRALKRLYTNMARLARIEEFEADARAAQIVDADLLGETLIEVSLKEHFLYQDYWPRVLAQSRLRAKPLVRPFRDLSLGMSAGFFRDAAGDGLSGNREPHPLHPTPHERLSALRVKPRIAVEASTSPSVAHRYLSPLLLTLAWVFDRAWWQDARPDWQLTYRDACRKHKRNQ